MSFRQFAGDLLVGNFGYGAINAFNASSGAFVGTLDGTDGDPLVIPDLWGLAVDNGVPGGGSLNAVYFTVGLMDEQQGLFGSLSAVPEPTTWAMMLIGFAGACRLPLGAEAGRLAADNWAQRPPSAITRADFSSLRTETMIG